MHKNIPSAINKHINKNTSVKHNSNTILERKWLFSYVDEKKKGKS